MTTISYIHQEKKNFTLRITARGSRYKIAKLQIHLYKGPFNYYVRTSGPGGYLVQKTENGKCIENVLT